MADKNTELKTQGEKIKATYMRHFHIDEGREVS